MFVVGAGMFGRHHLRVYRELAEAGIPVKLIAVVDVNLDALSRASRDFEVPGFTSVTAALEVVGTPDAASICVPTKQHSITAIQLLSAGVHCLVEKPLAGSLEEADEILLTAFTNHVVVQVGHLERFNPAIIEARAQLNAPMFFEAHRLSIFTPRSLDVDVVLDLMIHDLDIVLSFVDSPVREIRAVGLPVLSRKVDIANVRLEFENGCIANFTASRVSTERVRKLRFFQSHQYLSVDFARQDLLIIDVSAPESSDTTKLAALSQIFHKDTHPTPGLSLRKIAVGTGEPLRLEIDSFLSVITSGLVPKVSGEDGRRALALALSINNAIQVHATRTGF